MEQPKPMGGSSEKGKGNQQLGINKTEARRSHQGGEGSARGRDPDPVWVPGLWLQQIPWGPPPLQTTFDGNLECVALFLSQVISYMDAYGHFYPSPWVRVVAVTMTLTGDVADWVAGLHNRHAQELADLGSFLEALRCRFEDNASTQAIVEGDFVSLRQKGRAAKEYILSETSRMAEGVA